MNASRIRRIGGLLLGAFCAGCDGPDPTEPIGEMAFASTSGVKVNPPSNPGAVAMSHSQIDVSWQDNSSNETGFEVHRSTTGPTGAFTALDVTGAGAVSYGDGSGTPATSYCYQVRAFRTTGKNQSYSAFSSAVCATTKEAPRPAAPSGVNATPQFQGYRINVTWTDNSTDETAFRVERSATTAGPWSAVGTTGPGVTFLNHDRVPAADEQSCFRVFALNSFGDSGPSNIDCTAMPAPPTDLAATVLGDGTVVLTWADKSGIEEGYQLLRGTGSGEGLTVVATLPADATTYRDAGLPDNSYGYMVQASKDGGTSVPSNFVAVVVATRAPDAPANVEAVPASSSVVNVGWIDVAVNEEGSRVERSTNGGASWAAAGTTGSFPSLGRFAEEAPTEQEVCYRVIAFNRIGDSPASNMDCTAPPAAPTGFTATAVAFDVIDFSWTDNSGVEDGYQILIDYGYGYWETLASVGGNITSFRLEGFQPCCGYEAFYVTATKDGGTSDWSNPATPTMSAASRSGGQAVSR
jgi:hypothetical protein